jgi:hypothetical protein
MFQKSSLLDPEQIKKYNYLNPIQNSQHSNLQRFMIINPLLNPFHLIIFQKGFINNKYPALIKVDIIKMII